jgi:hypothetical protein
MKERGGSRCRQEAGPRRQGEHLLVALRTALSVRTDIWRPGTKDMLVQSLARNAT